MNGLKTGPLLEEGSSEKETFRKNHAAGIEASAMARPIFATIMIGRLRRRSTHVPTGNAKRSQGAIPAAVNIPNSSGVAPKTNAAIVGIAQPLN